MRKGLCTLIDWQKLDCQIVGTAENGLQAKQAVIDLQPDILIADIKMPVLDGLELAQWIHTSQLQVQIILLTAFADFSYAQQAIQYGVSDYITKTGNMDEIVDAVERCKQKLNRQRAFNLDMESRITSVLNAIMTGSLHREGEIQKQADLLGLATAGYAVAIVDLTDVEEKANPAAVRAGLEKLFYSLLPKDCLFISPQGKHELHLVFVKCADIQLRNFCFGCISTAKNLLDSTLYLGVSENDTALQKLSDALVQARLALQDRFYDQQELHFFRRTQSKRTPTHTNHFTSLTKALRSADLPQAEIALEGIFDVQRHQHPPEAQVKDTALMVLHTCRSALEEFGADLEVVELDRSEWKTHLQRMHFHQECVQHQRQLVQAVCRYIAEISAEGGNLLLDVQNFIDLHFCEPLTLGMVAAAVHVSPGYLSRFFRQKTGKTVMNTITGKKIEYACQLLEEGHLKIFEVAYQVGFEDTTYFSHVFKKYTGASAKEFRAQAHRRRSSSGG